MNFRTFARYLLLIAAFASACVVFGQSERGQLAGTITDSTGAVVPGARIVVTNTATNTSFMTVAGEAGSIGSES